jgi:hypothetical protein
MTRGGAGTRPAQGSLSEWSGGVGQGGEGTRWRCEPRATLTDDIAAFAR